jgi:hypothetical protein
LGSIRAGTAHLVRVRVRVRVGVYGYGYGYGHGYGHGHGHGYGYGYGKGWDSGWGPPQQQRLARAAPLAAHAALHLQPSVRCIPPLRSLAAHEETHCHCALLLGLGLGFGFGSGLGVG